MFQALLRTHPWMIPAWTRTGASQIVHPPNITSTNLTTPLAPRSSRFRTVQQWQPLMGQWTLIHIMNGLKSGRFFAPSSTITHPTHHLLPHTRFSPLRFTSLIPTHSYHHHHHHQQQQPLVLQSRHFSTRDRLRSAVRGRYLNWKHKQDEKLYNQSRIVCFGWIRLGPEPVMRMKSKDIRNAKEFKVYSESTTKWEKIRDSMGSKQFETTFWTRSVVFAIIGTGLVIAVLAEMWYKPTETPGWFEGSLSPEDREHLRTNIYPAIGWTHFSEDPDKPNQRREQILISGRDGGAVSLDIDPTETPLLAQTTPDSLAVLVYHDEYISSDRTLKKPQSAGPTSDPPLADVTSPQIYNRVNFAAPISVTYNPPQIDPQEDPQINQQSQYNDVSIVADAVPVEVLIGLHEPKQYLSAYLNHLPPTAPFPNQQQINSATKVLLKLPPIPPMPVKEPDVAYTVQELKIVDHIHQLNVSKLNLVEELLGTNKIHLATVRDEMDELYRAELALKERERQDQLGLLRQLRHHGVLASPSRSWVKSKIDSLFGLVAKEEATAITKDDFLAIYMDWKAVNRPLPQGSIDYSKDTLFDPQKSILSPQRWLEASKMVPPHDKPLRLHGGARFPSQFDVAARRYFRQEVKNRIAAGRKLRSVPPILHNGEANNGNKGQGLSLSLPNQTSSNNFYFQHLGDQPDQSTLSPQLDFGFDIDAEDEEFGVE